MKDDIIVYTDGACSGNPGKGGWAALIISQHDEEIISGSEKETTNNRMELMAVIKSLLKIKSNKVNIFTDSRYVKNGIEDWIHKWKQNGWMTANKQPVKNKDLWVELDKLRENKIINWQWVKGHSTNRYNNLVDEAARKAAQDQTN